MLNGLHAILVRTLPKGHVYRVFSGGGGGVYFFIACLSDLTIDHASGGGIKSIFLVLFLPSDNIA